MYYRLVLFGGAVSMLSLLLTAEPALGSERRVQEKAARKACLIGDYAKGVAILVDLFVETRDPVYIFNQGRCFEQNRRYEDAVGRFEEYLRAGETLSLKEDDKAAAKKHIADCRSRLPANSNSAQSTTPPLVPETVATPVPGPVPASEPRAELVEQPKPQHEPSRGRRRLLIAGIAVGAAGVAAVGAGIAFNLKVNSMVNDMETKVDQYSQGKDSNRKTYQTLGWVGYGVGAACIATGAVLIAVGAAARNPSSTRVALVPTVGPNQAGVLLSGAFQ
jgi:hypothetical protein